MAIQIRSSVHGTAVPGRYVRNRDLTHVIEAHKKGELTWLSFLNGIIPVLLLCFLLSAEDLVRDPADQDIRADPDHNAGGHAGKEEDRKI